MNRKRTHWYSGAATLGIRSAGDADLLEKLLDQARYSSRPPEILLTTRCRKVVWQMPATVLIRCAHGGAVVGRFLSGESAHTGDVNSGRNQLTSDLLDEWAKGNVVSNERRNMVVLYRRWKPINRRSA